MEFFVTFESSSERKTQEPSPAGEVNPNGIVSASPGFLNVAVASGPPFFEPKARRKEYGGLETTATPAEVSFSNDPAVRSRWRG